MNTVFGNMELESIIDIGDTVICDICDEDYSNSDESGGFVFSGKGYCPKCANKGLENIKHYGEERYIQAFCLPEKSFKDMIMTYRRGNNSIKLYTEK